MRVDPRCWAGVDVGGSRKGFHLAILDATGRLVVAGERIPTARALVDRLQTLRPLLVAVDAPRRPAEPGARSRACERDFVRADICALRFTPDLPELRANPFHEWVLRGLELYAALDLAGLPAIECFPTAAWTVWAGPRSGTPRGAWSGRALERLSVPGSPPRLGQDGRDAIAAALTARLHTFARTRVFGELVVPLPGPIGTLAQPIARPRDRALRPASSGVNGPRPPPVSHAQRQ